MESSNKPKVGLALSGGSALGVLHIGVLQSFVDHEIPIDCISGTSAGSVIATCFAFGVPLGQMVKMAKDLNWFKISKFSYSKMGIAKNETVGRMVIDLIGNVDIEKAHIPLAIVAADIETGEKVVFRKGRVAEAIMASTCIPGLFTPIKWNGKKLVDGGIVENLPLSPLADMGAKIKIGVNLAKWRNYRVPTSFVGVMLNSMDIMLRNQAALNPIVPDVMIAPHLEKYTTSDWNKATELIAEGYREATLAIPRIRSLIEGIPLAEKKPREKWFIRLWNWLKSH